MKKRILVNLILFISILFGTQVYATETEELPSKYDLRNDINIKVENQGIRPWCGYYATVKSVETYLQKSKGINYDLSEAYMYYALLLEEKHSNTSYREKCVLENEFPTKDYNFSDSNTSKFNKVSEKAVVKNYKNMSNIDMKNLDLKKYIMNYGGIFLEIAVDTGIENNKGNIYSKESRSNSKTYKGQHAVTIIGWNDNYSKDNFENEKPSKDGAWLILNSWGSNWGNKGTAWVSYEDYEAKISNMMCIKSLTLSTGETIETELEEKEEQKEEINNIEQQIEEQPKKQNIFEMIANKMHLDEQDIMIICVLSALVLSVIIVTVIYCKKRKKTNNKKEADKEKETEKELSLK